MKISRLLVLYGIAFVFSVLTGAVAAHFFKPSHRITIRQALAANNEQQIVEIVGDVRRIGENRFLLKDSTGIIVLETCPSWYRVIRLPNLKSVHVLGMVSKSRDLAGRHRTYFEVFRFSWDSGQEMVIRPSWGKPPWAISASSPVRVQHP